MIISLHFVSLNMLILIGSLCPMFTVNWLCHSILQIGLFIDAFTVFPWPLLSLAALVWVLGSDLLAHTYTHTHTVKSNYHMHEYVCTLNTLAIFIGAGRMDSLLLNPSVENSNYIKTALICRDCRFNRYPLFSTFFYLKVLFYMINFT